MIFPSVDGRVNSFIRDQIRKRSLREEREEAAKLYKMRRDDIGHIRSRFHDEKSWRVYQNVLKYRGSLNQKYLARRVIDDKQAMYFLFGREIVIGRVRFIDCGAGSGQAIQKLLSLCSDGSVSCRSIQIDAFEPDGAKFRQLEKLVLDNHDIDVNMSVHRLYLSDRRRLPDGRHIGAVRLDEFVPDGPPMSFLKLDTGYDTLAVLYGAREVIMMDRPYLAVRIDHTHEDMIDVPVYLFDAQPGYTWYVRHYSWSEEGTVLYGRPDPW